MDTADRAESLISSGARLLGEYLETHETDVLRRLAPVIVDLRHSHTLTNGRPDWSGRTPQYRHDIAQMFTRAHVPDEDVEKIQAALRYHVGNLIRVRADDDDLASAGLRHESPRERLANARRAHAAMRESQTPRGDVSRLTVQAQRLLDHIDIEALPYTDHAHLVAARVSLEHIQIKSAELLVRTQDALAGPKPIRGVDRKPPPVTFRGV